MSKPNNYTLSPNCGCGKPRAAKSFYCLEGKAKHMREWRKDNPKTGEARKRANCRSYAKVYLRRGKLSKQPCVDCGSPDVEMHHTDYDKPLQVTWLCRSCHLKRHGKLQQG